MSRSNAVVGLAALFDPELRRLGRATTSPFPTAWSTASRRRPATASAHLLADEFGIDDDWPVFCEDFKQWVLEDNFPAGRPALEDGRRAVRPRRRALRADEDPHPQRRPRHDRLSGRRCWTSISCTRRWSIRWCAPSSRKVEQRGDHPDRAAGARIPTSHDYYRLIERRFANPKIGDTIRRLCLDGSNRQPKFILPSIADRLAQGLPVDRAGAGLGALVPLLLRRRPTAAQPIAPNDPNWDRLQAQAAGAPRTIPRAWLAMDDIYGAVGRDPTFRAAFEAALRSLWTEGTAITLRTYLGIAA